MAKDQHAARRQRLIRQMKQSGAQALLVTSVTNVKYLTGFSGDSSYLLIGRGLAVLISDSRYTVQISQECPGLETAIRPGNEPIVKTTARLAKQAKLSKLGFESGTTSFDQWEALKTELKATELVPVSGLVEKLRAIKDSSEIAEIREAVRQAERGFEILRASLLPEMTERQVAHDLEHSLRRLGANCCSFDPIIAVGEQAALPHARPGDRTIGSANFVLVDWGASTVSGYKSDLTRVLVTGKISPKLEKIYRVVLNAQRLGIEAIRPGARCCDVDAAARDEIAKSGFAKNFGHGLGHGIGLDIHEEPRLSGRSQEELQPGMVITVEPGIYVPGWGGVRIEDDVLVTRDGFEVLTSVPKEFESACIG